MLKKQLEVIKEMPEEESMLGKSRKEISQFNITLNPSEWQKSKILRSDSFEIM